MMRKQIEIILRSKLKNVKWMIINEDKKDVYYKSEETLGGNAAELEENVLKPMLKQFIDSFYAYYHHLILPSEIWPKAFYLKQSTDEINYRIYVKPEIIIQAVNAKLQNFIETPAEVKNSESKSEFKTTEPTKVNLIVKDQVVIRTILILDKTRSMDHVLEAAKEQLLQIPNYFKKQYPDANFEVAVILFSDYNNDYPCVALPFYEPRVAQAFIKAIPGTESGDDYPEAVELALYRANHLQLPKPKEGEKHIYNIFMVTDSVPHGAGFSGDKYPNPEHDWKGLITALSRKGYVIHTLTCEPSASLQTSLTSRYPGWWDKVWGVHEEIATMTTGKHVKFSNSNVLKEIIGGSIVADLQMSESLEEQIRPEIDRLIKKGITDPAELRKEISPLISSNGRILSQIRSEGRSCDASVSEVLADISIARSPAVRPGSAYSPISMAPKQTVQQPAIKFLPRPKQTMQGNQPFPLASQDNNRPPVKSAFFEAKPAASTEAIFRNQEAKIGHAPVSPPAKKWFCCC